ncbi:MAG: HAD-IB family hydrolase [Ilumatobacteraceae bacterium]|nr:HAD-IB family hydrolase [Ilumatobacteraceae bacterium]
MHLTVAAFDVDGTLTTHDSVVPFLRRVAGTSGLARGLVARSRSALPALVRRDRDTLKALAAEVAFAGRPVDELIALGVRHGEQIHAARLRRDTVARLAWHRAQGHRVVMVSASFELYLHELGDRLGVDGVLGTRLEVGPDGRCTGRLDGPNCRGPEKVRRLHEWLDVLGGRSAVLLWAYGDSAGDDALLADADHPVRVGRAVVSVAPS